MTKVDKAVPRYKLQHSNGFKCIINHQSKQKGDNILFGTLQYREKQMAQLKSRGCEKYEYVLLV